MSPLFDITFSGGKTWGYKGQTFLLPDNGALDSSSAHYGDSYAFSSREKVQEHFTAKVGVNAKYKYFSGEFSVEYSHSTQSDAECDFGLMESCSQLWRITLKDKSAGALGKWVTDDPDYQNIPDAFTLDDRAAFFRFFDKYGTHFVSTVVVGGRLYYSALVNKSYAYGMDSIKAKLKAEFNAVFIAGSVTSEAEWEAIGEKWANERSVKVNALGGDNSILNVLAPGFNTTFSGDYKTWLESVYQQPAVIDFELSGVDVLFSGSKADAVREAIAAYSLTRLFVESKTGSCTIYFNGSMVLPPGSGIQTYGCQLAVIDRKELALVFAKSYAKQGANQIYDYQSIYQQALDDIEGVVGPSSLIAFTTWSMCGVQLPPKKFYDFLVDCGAGIGLDSWHNLHDLPDDDPNWGSADVAHCNYAFVGIPGSGKGAGYEAFERAGSSDTGDRPWHPNFQGWLDAPASVASVMVDLCGIVGQDLPELVRIGRTGISHP